MPERRVPPRTSAIAGANLTVSTEGGYSVLLGGDYVGYIHASVGGQWNAYRRHVDAPDDYLGRFTQEDAVRRIVQVSGSGLPSSARTA
jgi:hypothetical protein